MLQSRGANWLKEHIVHAGPLFLVCGLALIIAIPGVKPRRNFVDESAVNIHKAPIVLTPRDVSRPDKVVHEGYHVVHGWRSVGSETTAIYVNRAQEASVVLANFLIKALQKKTNMGCDTHFYFVNESDMHWPIPDSFVRSAFVINISTLNTQTLCFSVYGKDGMQPNQDLFNVAAGISKKWNIDVNLLCQNPHAIQSVRQSKYGHYLAALQTALIAPQHPKGWHDFRSHQISTLAISTMESDDAYDHVNAYPIAALHEEVITTMGYLDERFHHSTSVWVPLGVSEYVEYDVAQFGIFLLVASILCTCYSIYSVEGLKISPCVALIWGVSLLASCAVDAFGIPGFVLFNVFAASLLSGCSWDLSWLTVNAVALCLLIILQPAAGLLVGSGTSAQLIFLDVKCRKSLRLQILGTIISWIIFSYFAMGLDITPFDRKTIGGAFVSFFLYPNGVWITSRLFKCFFF